MEYLEKIDYLHFSHIALKRTQRLIVINQDLADTYKGGYRVCNVSVGGRLCPPYVNVYRLINEWLYFHKNHTPLENHIKFELIHPFVDGNGRTGRMLMWWQEIKEGNEPTLFKADERQEYYKLFDHPTKE